jgi:hypothetical protein
MAATAAVVFVLLHIGFTATPLKITQLSQLVPSAPAALEKERM